MRCNLRGRERITPYAVPTKNPDGRHFLRTDFPLPFHMKSARLALAALAFSTFAVATAQSVTPATMVPSSVAQARSTDYSNILPADETGAVLVIHDLFKASAFDARAPMAKLLAHPAVGHWRETILPKQLDGADALKSALGLSEKDLARLLTGKLVVAGLVPREKSSVANGITASAESADATGGGEVRAVRVNTRFQLQPVALIEFKGGSAEYESLVTKLAAHIKSKDAKADVATERVDGLLIQSCETDAVLFGNGSGARQRVFHALHQGVILVAQDKSMLRDLARSLARGAAENPLSGRSDFISVKREMGANDGFFLANLSTLMPMANNLLGEALRGQVEANPTLKALIDPETVVRAIALDHFTTLYGGLTMNERRLEARYGITWKDKAGLPSLINFGPDPVRVPAYVTRDYKGMDVSTVDFQATLDAGLDLVKSATPGGYGMAGMMLASNPETEALLTSLRKGVLDNFRPEVVSLTGYSEVTPGDDATPGKVWVFSLRDAAAAQSAIESALAMDKKPDGSPAVSVEIKDYLGVKIHRLPEVPMPFDVKVATSSEDARQQAKHPRTVRPAYAFVGDRLLVSLGSEGLIEGVIGNMKNPGKPLVDERFDDALGELPGVPCSVAYGDVATYLKTTINETLQSGKHRGAGLSDADLTEARSACNSLRYFWVSKSFHDKGGLYGRLMVAEQASENR